MPYFDEQEGLHLLTEEEEGLAKQPKGWQHKLTPEERLRGNRNRSAPRHVYSSEHGRMMAAARWGKRDITA